MGFVSGGCGQPKAKTDLLTQDILDELGDRKSRGFYRLVAAKIPERVIRETLSEIKHNKNAKHPPSLFTSEMGKFALHHAKQGIG